MSNDVRWVVVTAVTSDYRLNKIVNSITDSAHIIDELDLDEKNPAGRWVFRYLLVVADCGSAEYIAHDLRVALQREGMVVNIFYDYTEAREHILL